MAKCDIFIRRANKMHRFFYHQWFNSTILFSTCFEQLSVQHQEDCTSSFMVFYHADIIIKLYELCRYKIFSWYRVTNLIFYT
jgi:hypothetical protein